MATHTAAHTWKGSWQGQPRQNSRAATAWLALSAAIAVIVLCTGTLSSGQAGGLPSLTFATLLSTLQDLFSSLLFSTAALLAMLYAATRMLPAKTASRPAPQRSTFQSTPARPASTGTYASPFPFADGSHYHSKPGRNGTAQGSATASAYTANKRPLPTAPAVPSPLIQHAETLLSRARTIPNFTTTPLAGQHRVLTKLAANFVPPPQRHAAVTLAVFRLRQPAKAA